MARMRRAETVVGSPAILERNLERYPWAKLSDDKGDQLRFEVLLDAAGEEGAAWEVVAGEGSKLPGPFASDTWVVLSQLYNAAGRPESRSISVNFRELADLLHRPMGGTEYAAINGALHQLAQVSIRAVNTFREGPVRAELRIFHLLDSVRTTYKRRDNGEGVIAHVQFSAEVAASIAAGYFRLLDTERYFALSTPTARRLFRYLDVRRWRGKERRHELTLSLKELAAELPIDRDAPTHVRRTLDPAHAHLIERGFLEAAEYEERPVAGRKRPSIWVHYTFKEPEPDAPLVLPPAAPGRKRPARPREYLEETVKGILELLGDEHSVGFYTRAAKAMPPEVLEHILAGVKESVREGLSTTAARKVFTSSVRTQARALGVEL